MPLLGNRVHATVALMPFEPVNADPGSLLASIMIPDDASATRTASGPAKDLAVQRMAALLDVNPSVQLFPVDLFHLTHLLSCLSRAIHGQTALSGRE